jgi:dienelactone hydrolase
MSEATPIFFGGAEHLAGWLTPGVPGASPRRCAVLLCPPVGHEYMCSHRAFRRLALDLASQGFPVMRFDYYGTGNSAGEPGTESLVPRWTASVLYAADALREWSGCDTLAFVGLRFGANLAVAAAAGRNDVSSLVLWSPCVNGRSLVRQTRMLAMAAAEHPDDLTPETEGMESVGFLLDAVTVADIASADMVDRAEYSVANALIMTSGDAQPEQRLVTALQDAGVDYEERVYANHAAFMVTPLHSVLPTGAIETVVTWLGEKHPRVAEPTAGAEPVAIPYPSSAMLSEAVCESAVTFANGRLAGILAEPSSGTDNPAVLLLNTGSDHHVGPHRMYVPLARSWAELGFPVLRFDLGGIGESEPDYDSTVIDSYPPAALEDIRDAIAYLRIERGHQRVILVGMCSGGYYSVHSEDSAVSAVITVNPPLYHHAGDPIVADPHFNNYREARRVTRSLLVPAKWRRLLSGRVDVQQSIATLVRRGYVAMRETGEAVTRLLARDASERDDPALLFREGVTTHMIFTGGDKAQLFFEREIDPRLRPFRQNNRLTVDIVPGADHTFMPIRWQRALGELMTQRLLEHRVAVPGRAADR